MILSWSRWLEWTNEYNEINDAINNNNFDYGLWNDDDYGIYENYVNGNGTDHKTK